MTGDGRDFPEGSVQEFQPDPAFPLPEHMELVLESLGAEVVEYNRQDLCCGAALGINTGRTREALEITEEKLGWMEQAGLEALAVTCPACFTQFDSGQAMLRRDDKGRRSIAVFHIAELVALALGADEGLLGLETHRISVLDCISLV
jgi:heterodisulfide reductase subunit B